MNITTRGFKEAVAKLNQQANIGQSIKFRTMLLGTLEPAREAIRGNINSISGKTSQAIVISRGKGQNPSANLKVDRKVAMAPWKKSRRGTIPYPFPVEFGHGKTPAHPFFFKGVASSRSEILRLLREGTREVLEQSFSPSGIGGEFL